MSRPLIITYSGRHVNPTDLRPEDICIEDIAHALALCNRFAGHTRRPISVAQHSVYVARLCRGVENRNIALESQALLHDASEAYLGDITKWLKSTSAFAEYRIVEARIQSQIFQAFDCVPPGISELSPEVEEADRLMLCFEGEQAFGTKIWNRWIEGLPPVYALISKEERNKIGAWAPWSWKASERGFLDAARSLGFIVRDQG